MEKKMDDLNTPFSESADEGNAQSFSVIDQNENDWISISSRSCKRLFSKVLLSSTEILSSTDDTTTSDTEEVIVTSRFFHNNTFKILEEMSDPTPTSSSLTVEEQTTQVIHATAQQDWAQSGELRQPPSQREMSITGDNVPCNTALSSCTGMSNNSLYSTTAPLTQAAKRRISMRNNEPLPKVCRSAFSNSDVGHQSSDSTHVSIIGDLSRSETEPVSRAATRPTSMQNDEQLASTSHLSTVPLTGNENDFQFQPDMVNFRCVATASTHQGDMKMFASSGNKQCVAMSACAIASAVIKGLNEPLCNRDLDNILQEGNRIYKNILNGSTPRLLTPEELPASVTVNNYNVQLIAEWKDQNLLPISNTDIISKSDIKQRIINLFANYELNEGYIVIRQIYAFSFWQAKSGSDTKYYFYNSHAIDNNNQSVSFADKNAKSRLFEMDNVDSLVDIIFNDAIRFGNPDDINNQYSIHKVKIVHTNSMTTPQTRINKRKLSPQHDKQTQPKVCKPSNSARVSITNDLLCSSTEQSVGQLLSPPRSTKAGPLTRAASRRTSVQSIEQLPSSPLSTRTGPITRAASRRASAQSKEQLPSPSRSTCLTPAPLTQITHIDNHEQPNKGGRPKKRKRGSLAKTNQVELNHLPGTETVTNLSISLDNCEQRNKRGRPKKKKPGPVKITPQVSASATTTGDNLNNVHSSCIAADLSNQEDTNNLIQEVSEILPVAQTHESDLSLSIDSHEQPNRGGRPRSTRTGRPTTSTRTRSEQNRIAVETYQATHPEVNLRAVQTYQATHPEINLRAVQTYQATHPEVNLLTSQNYRTTHTNEIRQAEQRYNINNRYVPRNLRGKGLLGKISGEDLNLIPECKLKYNLTAAETKVCSHCGTRLFDEEKTRKMWCCGNGKYNILNLPPINEDFYDYPEFLRHSQGYNNLFAFTALRIPQGYHHPRTGISFIKIQGRIYHEVCDLDHTDSTGVNPYGMYIYDAEEQNRIIDNRSLQRDIVRSITHYLNQVNPIIPVYKQLAREESSDAHLVFEKTNRQTHGNILGDMPRGSEVAAIISNDREPYVPKSISVWKIGEGGPRKFDIFHPLYEALQYPLLYPHGGCGWTVDTKDKNNQKLSQLKYYRCLFLSESRFSVYGRLSDTWLVDMMARIFEERLRYISNMQKPGNSAGGLRAAPAEELDANIRRQIEEDETIQGEGFNAGKKYLPASFTGGPRYMKTKYLDSMALVTRLGKPSYFITMTCNPKWPEIQAVTPQGRNPTANVCARVFQLKLTQLMNDLKHGAWFGKLIYSMHVIEFQKRGLPHAHICVKVEGGDVAGSTSDINDLVRADIPQSSEANGRLQKLVLQHMIHGPCGRGHRTDLPCWDEEKGKCKKYFPKPCTENTFIDDRGFVHLRRDENNTATIRYRGRQVTVNDTWVVPYNAPLLLRYDCHINFEIASTRKIVKYLFKYMTKGPDETRVAVIRGENMNTTDEIEEYSTKRYIGACEAVWRLFEFDITARTPSVTQLAVHLENYHTIFYTEGNETEARERSMSTLMVYFNRPAEEEFDNLTYRDFAENYIVETKRPSTQNVPVYSICNGRYYVKKRQRNEMVARMFWIGPSRGEQFYLRLLLSTFPCRSYDDLRLLGGPECRTFQEAARVRGMVNDQIEYETCLEEAAGFYTGRRLRHFFVLLITNGAPAAMLWDKYKSALCEDYLDRMPSECDRAYSLGLIQIDRHLRRHGSSLQEHGLPAAEDDTTELGRELFEYNSNTLQNFVEHWQILLSPEQKEVFDYVVKLLTDEDFKNQNQTAIFLDGPSGTGKTLLLNVIVAFVRGVLKKVAICTASSGIASQNYEGGCTAHSMFRLPIDLTDDSGYWNVTNGSQRGELIRESSLIIYDEAPMSHKYLIHMLDRSLRDLMRSTKPFGNKIIIFSGDFRQIPPVVPNARNNSDVVQASLRTSPLWREMKKMSLSQAQRTRDDNNYSEFILSVGSGECETFTINVGRERQTLVSLTHMQIVTQLKDLTEWVFPSTVLNDADMCAERAILSPLNANIKQINAEILGHLPGELIQCRSVDYVDDEHVNSFYLMSDTLHNVEGKGVPDHILTIKINCVCMIMRNLSFADRLVNGTKVIVTNVSPRLITVRKPGETELFMIPRITFKVPIEPNSPLEMYRRQFPLQVCYAMTIHKAQGQTISRVGLDLRNNVFSHGMLYVALGRVRRAQDILILVHMNHIIDGTPYGRNVVYRDLIREQRNNN